MNTAKLTVTENQTNNGMLVVVYDEKDHSVAEFDEMDIQALYMQGFLNARFGSFKFKSQIKHYLEVT